MARRVVFHIGLAKTGTTSFQRFCREHRRWLAAHGVLYPRREVGRAHNHSPLVASYIPHRPEGPTVAVRWRPRAAAVRRLADEIAGSAAPTALISSEHFSNHFDRTEAAALAADFAAFAPTVVVTLRDPHARFLSAYNTHVTAGGSLPLEDYARSVLIPGTRYMSGRETVRIWADAFGVDAIRIVDYDGDADVSRQILAHCGIGADPPGASGYRDRPSLGPAAVAALRALNAAMAEDGGAAPGSQSLAAWLRSSAFSVLCRRELTRSSSGTGRERWTVSPRTMAELDAVAADDRAWVADTFGIALRGANARERIVVGEPRGGGAAEALLARALLGRVGFGLWRPSGYLVALCDALTARGRPPPPSTPAAP